MVRVIGTAQRVLPKYRPERKWFFIFHKLRDLILGMSYRLLSHVPGVKTIVFFIVLLIIWLLLVMNAETKSLTLTSLANLPIPAMQGVAVLHPDAAYNSADQATVFKFPTNI
jgi:hypothetical protein